MSQIQVTKYSKELQKQLFPDNEFYKKSLSESGLTVDAATFEIPNLTDIDEAEMGSPTSLPLQVGRSIDDKVTGTMQLIYAKPLVIEDEEEIVTNYNKRLSKQMQQASAVNTKAADYAAFQWLPSATGDIVSSTGSARATGVTGLTSTRKALTKADVLKAKQMLMKSNALNVPGELFALVTPDAYNDLLSIAEFVDYDKTGNTSKLEQGVLGKILGFNIMVRSKGGHIGALYSAANAKLTKVVTAATDRPVNLFWHSGMVCHAESGAKAYIKTDDPSYLGTLISAKVRFGAEICRKDEKGVVAIAEVAS